MKKLNANSPLAYHQSTRYASNKQLRKQLEAELLAIHVTKNPILTKPCGVCLHVMPELSDLILLDNPDGGEAITVPRPKSWKIVVSLKTDAAPLCTLPIGIQYHTIFKERWRGGFLDSLQFMERMLRAYEPWYDLSGHKQHVFVTPLVDREHVLYEFCRRYYRSVLVGGNKNDFPDSFPDERKLLSPIGPTEESTTLQELWRFIQESSLFLAERWACLAASMGKLEVLCEHHEKVTTENPNPSRRRALIDGLALQRRLHIDCRR